MARSMLFVPGDSMRKFDHACASAADALILDLEDSVAPEQKPAARMLVQTMLAHAPANKQIWVRVNALGSTDLLADLVAAIPARPLAPTATLPWGIVLPKCRGRADLQQLSHYLDALEAAAGAEPGAIRILAIATETAQSLFGLPDYRGATARLWGISWGAEDLAADLGALGNRSAGRHTEPFRLARSLCLMAAAAAGVRAIDTVHVDLAESAQLADEAGEAFRDGFTGKMAIHPKHLETIHAQFSPSSAQQQWAHGVIRAFAANPLAGALRLDGKMVDRPHLRMAQRLLGKD